MRLHAGAEYLVYFIGFTPGLPYMTGMPERINIPRLDTPRTKTPPGSVGHRRHPVLRLLGREPGRLLDSRAHAGARSTIPSASEPTLLRPGDRVRFRRIDRAEFDAIGAAVAARSYRPVIS